MKKSKTFWWMAGYKEEPDKKWLLAHRALTVQEAVFTFQESPRRLGMTLQLFIISDLELAGEWDDYGT